MGETAVRVCDDLDGGALLLASVVVLALPVTGLGQVRLQLLS